MNKGLPEITYLDRTEIETEKWDQCILQASNGLIYARSFYLDNMSKNWSALVLNDFEAIMPLTWNRKYGISYLYQPAFTAQLGVFFKNNPGKDVFEKFIQKAKSHFKFCEIHLNFANPIPEISQRANYILNLNRPYIEIREGYKKRLLENLQEAGSQQLQYQAATDYSYVIRLFKTQYGKRFGNVRESDYHHFENLCGLAFQKNMAFIRQISDENGELLNTSIFFQDDHRIYNIMSVSLPAGREKRAHFFLLDHMILEFSSRELVFDFEGSEIPGIAEFYRKFGSINQSYPFLSYNLLPFPIRLFK